MMSPLIRQADHSSQRQFVFGDLIFLRDQLLLFLLQLHLSARYVNRCSRPSPFLVGSAVVDGLVRFHLCP